MIGLGEVAPVLYDGGSSIFGSVIGRLGNSSVDTGGADIIYDWVELLGKLTVLPTSLSASRGNTVSRMTCAEFTVTIVALNLDAKFRTELNRRSGDHTISSGKSI